MRAASAASAPGSRADSGSNQGAWRPVAVVLRPSLPPGPTERASPPTRRCALVPLMPNALIAEPRSGPERALRGEAEPLAEARCAG